MNASLKKVLIGMAAGAFGISMVACGGGSADADSQGDDGMESSGGEASCGGGEASCGAEAGGDEGGEASCSAEAGGDENTTDDAEGGEGSCGEGSCGG